MRQEHETFVPHVLAITQRIDGRLPQRRSDLPQRVLAVDARRRSTWAATRRDRAAAERFAKAGLVKVYCHIHSHMSAPILVLDHPYFAIPSDDGTFTICRTCRPGEYTVVGWHERIGERTAIDPRRARARPRTVELTLPVEDLQ